MFKRLRWMFLGALFAAAAYLWFTQRGRTELPERGEELARSAGTAARDLKGRVQDAYREGRVAMEAREAELRREVLGEG